MFRLRQSKEELDGAREKRGSFFPLSVRLSCSPALSMQVTKLFVENLISCIQADSSSKPTIHV